MGTGPCTSNVAALLMKLTFDTATNHSNVAKRFDLPVTHHNTLDGLHFENEFSRNPKDRRTRMKRRVDNPKKG